MGRLRNPPTSSWPRHGAASRAAARQRTSSRHLRPRRPDRLPSRNPQRQHQPPRLPINGMVPVRPRGPSPSRRVRGLNPALPATRSRRMPDSRTRPGHRLPCQSLNLRSGRRRRQIRAGRRQHLLSLAPTRANRNGPQIAIASSPQPARRAGRSQRSHRLARGRQDQARRGQVQVLPVRPLQVQRRPAPIPDSRSPRRPLRIPCGLRSRARGYGPLGPSRPQLPTMAATHDRILPSATIRPVRHTRRSMMPTRRGRRISAAQILPTGDCQPAVERHLPRSSARQLSSRPDNWSRTYRGA